MFGIMVQGMNGGVANCWGTYDFPSRAGHKNMCQRFAPPEGEYVPEVAGYWYIWVR
jgi:hypothetical protein|eukprot:COSAG06_NODE_212_length_20143_cov_16.516713_4_plen_56_part_00